MRHLLLPGLPLLISALVLIGADAPQTSVNSTDTDNDGMPDAFEQFYGLDYLDSQDALMDYDGDRLLHAREAVLGTDPFAPDTDRDGFNDDADANPISRAYIQWGAARFTTGDQYDYAHPDWLLGAYKTDGEWLADKTATQSAWHVEFEEPSGIGRLSLDLDRTILTNNLVFAVHYLDNSRSSLYVDLLDTNGMVVGEDLFGNLMTGSNREEIVRLALPLAALSNAAVVHLRRGTGEVTVFESLLYVDEDGDGLDADQEIQFGTSDQRIDTNGNGITDYNECFNSGSSTNKAGGGGNDDGKDKDEDKEKDARGVIYVDQAQGSDAFTGRAPLQTAQRVGSARKGPKKTVRAGLSIVSTNDVIIIKPGNYRENLNISGKDVKVFIEGNVKL